MPINQQLVQGTLAPPLIVEVALESASNFLCALGNNGSEEIVFYRNFAAIVIAYRNFITERTVGWQDFEKAIMCEAWIGDEAGYQDANRDYLENAKRKAFTSWRLMRNNGDVLINNRELLAEQDSSWPGAIWAENQRVGGGLAVATSALTCDQDEFLSGHIAHTIYTLGNQIAPTVLRYGEISGNGKDTIGGESFDYAPKFKF